MRRPARPSPPAMSPIDLNSSNADYLEALYQRYQADPASVDPEWAAFFRGFDYGYLRAEEEEEGEGSTAAAAPAGRPPEPAVPPPAQPAPAVLEDREHPDHTEHRDRDVIALVRAYRQWGHYIARLDPLGDDPVSHPLLELSEFGLTGEDLEKGRRHQHLPPRDRRHPRRPAPPAAPDLLRQPRHRHHVDLRQGPGSLARGARRADPRPPRLQPPGGAPPHPLPADRGGGVRALPAHPPLRGAEAVLHRGRRRPAPPFWTPSSRPAAASASRRWSSAWPTAGGSTSSPTSCTSPTR